MLVTKMEETMFTMINVADIKGLCIGGSMLHNIMNECMDPYRETLDIRQGES